MVRKAFIKGIFVGVLWLVVGPSVAYAQSGIAGQVTDSSGGVLPGVTVEAASPELIEKVRTAVTDGQGRYQIIDLRPGLYSVTFSLTGFNTVKRDGINLPGNFTANIVAQLTVGSLAETVTVTGATPVVDTTQAARTQVLTRDILDSLPTSRTSQGIGLIIPGIRTNVPDVGGSRAMENVRMSAHGAPQQHTTVQVDGMLVNAGDDAGVQAYHNDAMSQEFSYQTSAVSAEVSWGGIRLNMIPRQGGNTFSGIVFGGGTNKAWQSTNITPAQVTAGLVSGNTISHIYDVNASVGGPIDRDRLWFYASFRKNSVNDIVANNFYKDGRPGIQDQFVVNGTLRLTYQMNNNNKLTAYYDRAWKFKGHDMVALVEPETAAGWRPWQHAIYYVGQMKYTNTIGSRMLYEAGYSSNVENRSQINQPGVLKVRGTPEWYASPSKSDITRGTLTGGRASGGTLTFETRYVGSTALSYVTGSHNFKTGVQWSAGLLGGDTDGNADLQQRYNDGVPDSVEVKAWPLIDREHINADIGVFVQDAWTVKHLTISPGVRWDHFNGEIPTQSVIAGRFAPARYFPERKNLPNWNDVAPRFGMVYDLFGNGSTALKFGANKYMNPAGGSFANRYNPMRNDTDRRNWNDCAYLAGTSTCNPALIGAPGYHDDIAQDNEIGPSNNLNFGIAPSRTPAPDLSRGYNVEYMASVQRQVVANASVSASYYKRTYYNLEKQDNLLSDFSDYAAFQTPNPLNPSETITIYNLNRAKQGLVNILDVNSKSNQRFYNGVELSFTARLPGGGSTFGGMTMERTLERLCDVDDPNLLRFCDQTGKLFQELGKVAHIPYKPEFKLAGTHPLPMGLEISASLLSFPGQARSVTYTPAASVFPGAQRTQTVTLGTAQPLSLTAPGGLVAPGTRFGDRWNQLDVGVTKKLRIRTWQMEYSAMLFNSLNASPVLTYNTAFGATLDRPLSNLQPRLLRLSIRASF
jgi:hypothetical protein